jgi:hypothetical protein
VRDRRNRDRDNRRLWGDLRRSRPSRKEESEWTIIAPATSTLNFGEVDSLFTEVPRSGILGSLQCLGGSLGSWLPPKIHRGFIGARYGIGGVGLPFLSSSFSFPELLVGFPWAHPLLLPLFTRVRGREI